MVKFMKGAVLVGVASLALGGMAHAALLASSFKYEATDSKAAGKFPGALSKCASKCYANFWKGSVPNATDCQDTNNDGVFPDAATTTCVSDPIKGAITKNVAAFGKANKPPSSTCPLPSETGGDTNCYNDGDCSTYPADRTSQLYTIVNGFNGIVFCDTATTDKLVQGCQLNAAKVLSKYAAAIDKCYDKCLQSQFKGVAGTGTCIEGFTGTDIKFQACLDKNQTKTVAAFNKKCKDLNVQPNGGVAPCNFYQFEADNTTAKVITLAGGVTKAQVVNNTYCASPSGAFVQ